MSEAEKSEGAEVESRDTAPGGPKPDAGDQNTARTVGRGFLFILFAKGWFLITGFAVQFGLPRLFLRAAERMIASGEVVGVVAARLAEGLYGNYGVVTRTVSWINNTMVQGTVQAVSKFVAEDEERAEAVRSAGLKVQGVIGGTLALLYFLMSGTLAAWLKDPGLADAFRISAIIILAYAVYAVFIGYLNGRKRFHVQAGFDVTYSTIKTASIIGLALLGYGLNVVVGAFAGAAVAICVLAFFVVGVRRDRRVRFDWRVLLKAMLVVVVYYIFFNFLLTADLLVLKGLAGRVPADTAELAAQRASSLVGVYNGVLNLALLPYQGVLAVAFVIFPLISKSTFEKDQDATRSYIRNTLRYATIFVGMIATAVVAAPESLLAILNPSFAVGGTALRIYVSGEVFFALFAICNTIIIASGSMWVAAGLAAATLLLDLGSNLLFVPGALRVVDGALDPGGLVAAAGATAPVFFLGFVGASAYLFWKFRARLGLLTALRVAAVSGAIAFGATALPRTGFFGTAGVMVAAVVLYGLGLVLTRELGRADLARVRAVLQRKKGG